MKLLLFCISIMPLATVLSDNNPEVAKAFQTSQLSPGIVPIPPEGFLNVCYPSAEVCLGDEISPSRTMVPPKIDYDFKPGSQYTLVMIDPDAPSACAPTLGSYIIWIVINIEQGKYGSRRNDTIASYGLDIPYPGSGPHRYTILLYEQPKEIDPQECASLRLGIKRYRFNLDNFATRFGLGNPIAGNMFRGRVRANNDEYYCRNSNTCQSEQINYKYV